LTVASDSKTETRLTHNEGRDVIRKVIQIFNEEMPSGNLKCHAENSDACATTVTRIYEATIHLLRKLMWQALSEKTSRQWREMQAQF
jgi:hypothetical protein